MVKAVIFDMDGVIIDSEPIQSKSWELLLKERSIEPILKKNGLIHEVGPTDNSSYTEILERHGINLEELEDIKIRRREIFVNLFKKEVDPNPGFNELIKFLKEKKIKLAVASNRLIDYVHLMLDCVKAKKFFETIISPDSKVKRKPAPDIYLKTASNLGVKPEFCLAIEDSETGVVSAKSAGMKCIALITKWTKNHDLSKADRIVNSLKDINLSFLNSLEVVQ